MKTFEFTQAWFWDPGWQAGERQASRDIAEGRIRTFATEQGFLDELDHAP